MRSVVVAVIENLGADKAAYFTTSTDAPPQDVIVGNFAVKCYYELYRGLCVNPKSLELLHEIVDRFDIWESSCTLKTLDDSTTVADCVATLNEWSRVWASGFMESGSRWAMRFMFERVSHINVVLILIRRVFDLHLKEAPSLLEKRVQT